MAYLPSALAALRSFFLEHLQHAPRDQEAAEHVDGRQSHGEHAHVLGERTLGQAGGEHGAHDDDGRDRVGDRHERGMQGRGDVPHDVEAHVDGQHEDDDVDECRIDGFH